MTNDERAAYAREQRERCRPAECAHDPQCWVLWGGKGTLVPESMTKAVRCAACNGKLRWSEWREPPELAMSARAEFLARQQAKHFALDV